MDYAATYPNTYVGCNISNTILNVDKGVAYLVVPKAPSRIFGYYHLSS